MEKKELTLLDTVANIFGITMVVPFAAVPVSAALTAFQVFAAMFRSSEPSTAEMTQTSSSCLKT